MSRTLEYVVSQVLWLLSSALAVLNIVIAHRVLSMIYGLFLDNRWIHSALDRFGIVILAIGGLAFVVFCEYYYREGVERNEFWRRFGLVSGVEVWLLVLLTVAVFVL